MSHLWHRGERIEMRLTAEGQPEVFYWRKQSHPVQGINQRWRVDIEWWRLRIWRDYYRLHTQTGLLVVVYLDLERDCWYLLRLYD